MLPVHLEKSLLGDLEKTFPPGDSLVLRTDWSQHVENPGLYRDGLPRISDALAAADRTGIEKLPSHP